MSTAEKAVQELQSRAHLSSYQLEMVAIYMEWVYAIGYDSGRNEFAAKLNESKAYKVAAVDHLGNRVHEFDSLTKAGDVLGLDRRLIHRAIQSNVRHGGYYWRRIA